jgi:hypothetical protein
MSVEHPISLSDDQLSAVMRAAGPLHPADRSAFLHAVAASLRFEPDPGDGTVDRVIRWLLSSGSYRRNAAVAIGPVPRHDGPVKPKAGQTLI